MNSILSDYSIVSQFLANFSEILGQMSMKQK